MYANHHILDSGLSSLQTILHWQIVVNLGYLHEFYEEDLKVFAAFC